MAGFAEKRQGGKFGGLVSSGNVVLFYSPAKRRERQSQSSGSLGLIPPGLYQRFSDTGQQERMGYLAALSTIDRSFLDFSGKHRHIEVFAGIPDRESFHEILKFPHVTRPIIGNQTFERLGGEPRGAPVARKQAQEVVDQ